MGTERDDGLRPELQDQAVEPVDEPAPWANTAVHGRYPAGTDPHDALRETMSVFMERTDGSNAMPWWQQTKWWHAGPGGIVDQILPPSKTGLVPLIDSDPESVYVTSERDEALLYAAQHLLTAMPDGDRVGPMPRLYVVTFHMKPQPDDTQPDSTSSWRVPSAKIRRAEVPSRAELLEAMDVILDVHQRDLAARVIEAAEAVTRDA